MSAVNANGSANVLVHAQATEGTGAGVLTAVGSTNLTGTAGNALRSSSSEYGSDEFVDVNVLSGTFNTNATDGVSTTRRDIGRDIAATINGQAALTDGLKASVRTGSLDASLTFTEAANSTSTATTVTITGGGALFQIGQDVSVAGQLGVGIDPINTARLGGVSGKLYEIGSGGGKSLLDVGPNVQGSDLVDIIEESLSKVSTLRGRLGVTTIGDVLTRINSAAGVSVRAELNDTGDGFVLIDEAAGAGDMRVEEIGGTTAADLRILGTGVDGADGASRISSRLATVVSIAATDTLDDVAQKISNAGGPVTASVFDDGTPFNATRLLLASKTSGAAGRVFVDTGALDLGFSTASEA